MACCRLSLGQTRVVEVVEGQARYLLCSQAKTLTNRLIREPVEDDDKRVGFDMKQGDKFNKSGNYQLAMAV